MTAVTKIDGELVEIIDVEKILDVISPSPEVVSDNIVEEAKVINEQQKQQVEEKKAEVNRAELPIMVADDSSVARRQVERSMKAIGYKCILTKNGQEAYDKLCELVSDGSQLRDKVSLIISDVEMPEMDGYTHGEGQGQPLHARHLHYSPYLALRHVQPGHGEQGRSRQFHS